MRPRERSGPLISRRGALVRQRTREKNQIHAALAHSVVSRPPFSDVKGPRLAGRADR